MRNTRHRGLLVHRLLEEACRTAQWAEDPALPAAQRLERAFSVQRLEVVAPGIAISATVTPDLLLGLSVRLSASCDASMERALLSSLRRSPSLVAELLLADWPEVWRLCRATGESGDRSTKRVVVRRP